MDLQKTHFVPVDVTNRDKRVLFVPVARPGIKGHPFCPGLAFQQHLVSTKLYETGITKPRCLQLAPYRRRGYHPASPNIRDIGDADYYKRCGFQKHVSYNQEYRRCISSKHVFFITGDAACLSVSPTWVYRRRWLSLGTGSTLIGDASFQPACPIIHRRHFLIPCLP